MKVLIVDDNPRMREMIREMVAGVADSVLEAGDGTEAVARCGTDRPDWVLMDWRMKPMDGLAATRLIKVRFPETRVVIVSQHEGQELRTEAARAGACAYVLKEYLEELPAMIAGNAAPGGRMPGATRPAAPPETRPMENAQPGVARRMEC